MCRIQHIVNIIGLVCNFIGALLIWRYGLPTPINREGHVHVITGQIDETEKAKAHQYNCIATVGVFLLMLGFVFQLVSNFL